MSGRALISELRALAHRHDVIRAAPPWVPLVDQADHPMVIESTIPCVVDVDRIRFIPFCFGTLPVTLPLLIEHDANRAAAGKIDALTYSPMGELMIRATLRGAATRYGALSLSARVIEHKLCDVEDPEAFRGDVLRAHLVEVSLVQFPRNPRALIQRRHEQPPSLRSYDVMIERVQRLTQMVQQEMCI